MPLPTREKLQHGLSWENILVLCVLTLVTCHPEREVVTSVSPPAPHAVPANILGPMTKGTAL